MRILQILAGTDIAIVSFAAGHVLWVRHVLADSDDRYGLIEDEVPGSKRILFEDATIAVVKGLHENGRTCVHLFLARLDLHVMCRELRLNLNSTPCTWPRLARALQKQDLVPRIKMPYGFRPPVYFGEMAVRDQSDRSSGWIIQRDQIGELLATEPALAPPASRRLLPASVRYAA